MLFNKPFGVLCQFTDNDGRETLADYISAPGYYAAGRLDRDSEGLMVLTNDGKLQQRISDPAFKLPKTYLVQVDGEIDSKAIRALNHGIRLKDGHAQAFDAHRLEPPTYLWSRDPPIRVRKNIPTSWIQLTLKQGRNRQVRRMSAAVGFPTLRLIRTRIGECDVQSLAPGNHRLVPAHELLAN